MLPQNDWLSWTNSNHLLNCESCLSKYLKLITRDYKRLQKRTLTKSQGFWRCLNMLERDVFSFQVSLSCKDSLLFWFSSRTLICQSDHFCYYQPTGELKERYVAFVIVIKLTEVLRRNMTWFAVQKVFTKSLWYKRLFIKNAVVSIHHQWEIWEPIKLVCLSVP